MQLITNDPGYVVDQAYTVGAGNAEASQKGQITLGSPLSLYDPVSVIRHKSTALGQLTGVF